MLVAFFSSIFFSIFQHAGRIHDSVISRSKAVRSIALSTSVQRTIGPEFSRSYPLRRGSSIFAEYMRLSPSTK